MDSCTELQTKLLVKNNTQGGVAVGCKVSNLKPFYGISLHLPILFRQAQTLDKMLRDVT